MAGSEPFSHVHDLLHKKLGAEVRGTRRAAHTARFRAEEARFEGLAEAQRFLDDLARAERTRRRRVHKVR